MSICIYVCTLGSQIEAGKHYGPDVAHFEYTNTGKTHTAD